VSSGLTTTELTDIVIILALVAIALAFLLLVIRRLRERKATLLHELRDNPRLVSDRAYNRLAMARREASLLASQGGDTSRATEQLAQAQAAFDARQFDRSYELAQSAHESLVLARQRGPLAPPSGTHAVASPVVAAPGPTPATAPSPAPPPAADAPRIPKNRAESQFQLRLLDEALARPHSAGDAAEQSARAFASQAHCAFDAGDFTEAFRLALKARRTIGDGVEALAPAPGRAAPLPTSGSGGGRRPADPIRSAETVAAAERCPSCGHPNLPDDTFCRGCGTPRTPIACPNCGAARTPIDTFCGRCGQRYD
jgi:hypothetical protein